MQILHLKVFILKERCAMWRHRLIKKKHENMPDTPGTGMEQESSPPVWLCLLSDPGSHRLNRLSSPSPCSHCPSRPSPFPLCWGHLILLRFPPSSGDPSLALRPCLMQRGYSTKRSKKTSAQGHGWKVSLLFRGSRRQMRETPKETQTGERKLMATLD